MPAREWLGLGELTAYAAVSERTLRKWIHWPSDPLPAVQVGGKILVRRRDFDNWLERHPVQPADSVDVDGMVEDILGGLSGRG